MKSSGVYQVFCSKRCTGSPAGTHQWEAAAAAARTDGGREPTFDRVTMKCSV